MAQVRGKEGDCRHGVSSENPAAGGGALRHRLHPSWCQLGSAVLRPISDDFDQIVIVPEVRRTEALVVLFES